MKAFVVLAAAVLTIARAAAPDPPVAPGPHRGGVTDRYDDYFRKYTKRYFGVGFDWRLFKAQAIAESGLHPDARSAAGARGIMQLMPSTYAQIASVRPNYQSIDDPQWNIAAGILHDRWLWEYWADKSAEDDHHRFMLASYNAGEIPIARAQGIARRSQLDPTIWPSVVQVAPRVPRWRYRETVGYVRTIDGTYERIRAADIAPVP